MAGSARPFFAAAVFQSFAMSLALFAVTMRATLLGATDLELGVGVGAAPALVYALCCWAAGGLVQRFGPKPLLTVGCAALGLVCVLLSRADEVGELILLVCVLLVALSLHWPALMAWLAHGRSPDELQRVFPVYNLSWSAAAILGPFAGGVLLERVGPEAFLVAGAAALAPALALSSRPNVSAAATPPAEQDEAVRARDRLLWRLSLGANFALNAVHGLVFTFLPKIATGEGLSPTIIGTLVLFAQLAQTAIFGVLRASRFWRGRLWPLWAAQTAGALATAGVAWGAGMAAFGVACAAVGLGAGLTYHFSLYYSLQAGQGGRGSALHEANLAAAHVFGPLLGGLVAHAVSDLRAPFVGAAALLAVLTAAQALAFSARPRAAREAA